MVGITDESAIVYLKGICTCHYIHSKGIKIGHKSEETDNILAQAADDVV